MQKNKNATMVNEETEIGNTTGISDQSGSLGISEASDSTSEEDFYTEISEEESKAIEELMQHIKEDGLPGINPYQFRKDYPKVYKKFIEFMKVVTKGTGTMDHVVGGLLFTPRNVIVKFLDENEYFTSVFFDGADSWTGSIFDEYLPTRAEAELAEWDAAFKQFEAALK